MLLTLQANAKTITYDQTDMDDFHINFNVFGEDKTSDQWEKEMEGAEGDGETGPIISDPVQTEAPTWVWT